MHIHAQIISFVHLLNVISCSWCKYVLQSLFGTQKIISKILFIVFLSFHLFLSFCLLIILPFWRSLFFSFYLFVISSFCLSAYLSFCFSWSYLIGGGPGIIWRLISSFRGLVGMEWMWWSSLVNDLLRASLALIMCCMQAWNPQTFFAWFVKVFAVRRLIW